MVRKKQKTTKNNTADKDFNYEFATGMGLATETAGSSAAVTKRDREKSTGTKNR